MSKKHHDKPEQDVDFSKVGDPPPDNRKDWPAKPFTGAKWGAAAGAGVGTMYVKFNSPTSLGFYPGDAGAVIVVALLACTALGFVVGLLSLYLPGGSDKS